MKVYFSKYRYHWVSPYRIAAKLCFWREIDYHEPWVQKVNSVLEPVCTWWMGFLDFVHPKINYVKIDKYDTWSMDYTLGLIILPMLKQLKATKHGYPAGLTEKKWNTILDDMIWSFEQVVSFYDDEQFWIELPELDLTISEPNEDGLYPVKWKREGKLDKVGLKAHHDRIDKGLRLFGKYYRNLWD